MDNIRIFTDQVAADRPLEWWIAGSIEQLAIVLFRESE